ncbi:hypothetical protein THAOC_26771 [Thalassiosira oceanica]|uniref:Uncharacterized protein n=1 Tax=Thalassiosira oceanica TaxID=159749 RepID=K0RNC9_THAOC|nr:hypothetical protein THAOC_26771 [Thalassiosira oceanica]|eukprot:EJK53729.1 hypothetical protein THAOC_26771 [Thalassiosira oceanica]
MILTTLTMQARSRILTHTSTVTKVPTKNQEKNEQNHGAPRTRRIAALQPRTSLHRTAAVGNIESNLIDEVTPAAASSGLICKSEVEREANRQRCRRGAAEKPNTDIAQKEV